jgi:aminoglycoside phosphotransferase (APT) family kinase protein
MKSIQRAGFGPEQTFSIPQPVAYLPRLRLLLQEKVAGTRAKLIFVNGGDTDRADAAARAARWLAKFHADAPRAGHSTALTELLEPVERWSLRIAGLGEPFVSPARRLARRLAETAPLSRTTCVCAGHGSFSCHQIILGDGRTVTFDWDSYDVADPCRDVARFVVGLQRLAVKYHGFVSALDAAAEVFLTTYRARCPYDITTNLAWYRALTCLRLAKYEANRPVCTFPEGIEALLDEGLRVLEEKTT